MKEKQHQNLGKISYFLQYNEEEKATLKIPEKLPFISRENLVSSQYK